jgi:hypothetical protein
MLATMKSRPNILWHFLLGYVKDKVLDPHVPVTLDDLKQRIATDTAGIDEDILTRVWQEFDYALIYAVWRRVHTSNICKLL